MVKTFANTANLRATLLDPECPTILQNALPIINKAWKMNELLKESPEQTLSTCSQPSHLRSIMDIPELEDTLRVALPSCVLPKMVYTMCKVKLRKYGFSRCLINVPKSCIIFQPVGGSYLMPREIQEVFKLRERKTTYYLAVQRYLPPM